MNEKCLLRHKFNRFAVVFCLRTNNIDACDWQTEAIFRCYLTINTLWP